MPTRSENTEYAKALAQNKRLKDMADSSIGVHDDTYEIAAADRRRAQRELPKSDKKLSRVSTETGYNYSSRDTDNLEHNIDRLSRTGDEYSSGMKEGDYAPEDDTEPSPRASSSGSRYKKGGMVKKKSGGSVRGAGLAQRGQGKMRMC